jgi:hypothetical protein
MSIELNFFLRWDEYYTALEFFRARRSNAATDKKVGGLLILLGILLWPTTNNGLLVFAFIIGGMAVAVLSAPVRRWLFKQRWEREPLYGEEFKITLDEQGVIFQLGAVKSNLPWSYYESFLESPDGFLLIYGETFNLFPKRSFANAGRLADFRALLEKKLLHPH